MVEPLRTIKVHILIDGLGWGGAEMLLGELAAGAPSGGIELSVGYLKDKDRSPAACRLRDQGVEPTLVPVNRLLEPGALPRVRRHLAAVAPDIVHTHLGYADLLGGLAAKSLGIPAVSSIHVMEWERNLRDSTKLALFALARRHCMRTVVTVSEAARAQYLHQGWDRPERVLTVHNGIVGQAQPGAGKAVRAELGLGSAELVVAIVSVLRAGKGHEVALEAIRLLAGDFPHLRFLVLGEGPERERVEALAEPLGERVLVTGHRDDVMSVLDAVDVVVHPSSFDAFPTALLEAMAASVPVVASRVGGIPEIVVEGDTGLLVDSPPTARQLAAALSCLLEDADARRRLGARGRQRFEEVFSASRWAQRLAGVYQSILSPGPAVRAPMPAAANGTEQDSRAAGF